MSNEFRILIDEMMPAHIIEFRSKEGKVLGQIVNVSIPKEKEKCWCEIDEHIRTGVYLSKKLMDGWQSFKTNFCPECGRKL